MKEKLLTSLGLSESETKIYKTMLKVRSASPAVLAKIAGAKRTTAYHTARTLVEKGLLVEDSTKRPKIFILANQDDIQALIDAERIKFADRERILTELSSELSCAGADESYPVPKIHFVEEEKLEQFLYKAVLRWNESVLTQKVAWWGFQDHTFADHYTEVIEWYWKKTGEKLAVNLLSNRSETEKKMAGKYPRRNIKFWDKTNHFLSTTWIAGDYVIMINTRNHPFYLVETRDATLANDMREIFKNLWTLV